MLFRFLRSVFTYNLQEIKWLFNKRDVLYNIGKYKIFLVCYFSWIFNYYIYSSPAVFKCFLELSLHMLKVFPSYDTLYIFWTNSKFIIRKYSLLISLFSLLSRSHSSLPFYLWFFDISFFFTSFLLLFLPWFSLFLSLLPILFHLHLETLLLFHLSVLHIFSNAVLF